MADVTPNGGNAKPQTSSEIRQIGAKWGKFSQRYLSALKNKNDLVAQIVAKWTKLLRKTNPAPPKGSSSCR
jgi:hypothetical protein